MFCNKCGKELKDGVAFCIHCGAAVEARGTNNNVNQANYASQGGQVNYVSQGNQNQTYTTTVDKVYETEGSLGKVAPTPEKPKKKMPLRTRIIAIAVVVAFLVGSGLFVWFNPYTNNWLMRTVLNSEDYTRYVIGKNLKNLSSNLTDENIEILESAIASGVLGTHVSSDDQKRLDELDKELDEIDYDDYDTYSDYYDDWDELWNEKNEIYQKYEDARNALQCKIFADSLSGTSSVSAEVKLNDVIKDIIEENMGNEADSILWIDNANAKLSFNSTGDKASVDAGLNINKTNIASANVGIDSKTGVVYISAPNVLKDDVKATLVDTDSDEYKECVKTYENIMAAMPDAKTAEKILTRYITCVLEQIDDVDEDREKLEVGEVSQKCTTLSFTIDDKLGKNVAEAVLKEAKNDTEIKNIIKNVAKETGADPDEVIEEYEEGIESALDEIKDFDPEGEDYAKIKLWVNARGEITGIDVTPVGAAAEAIESELGGKAKFSAYDVVKGKKCASSIKVSMGSGNIVFEGEGTIKKNKRSMDCKIKAIGVEIADIKIRNFDEKKRKDGLFSGTIEISASETAKVTMRSALEYQLGEDAADMLANAKFVIEGNMDSANSGRMAVKLISDNEQIVKIEANTKRGNGNVSLPSKAKDITNEDIDDYLDSSKIIDALEEAGAPSELTDELEDY